MNNSTEFLTSSPTRSFSRYEFTTNVVLMSVGAVALLGNGLISCVILKYKSLREKLDAVHLIGYLAICDAFEGLGAMIAAADRFRVSLSTAPRFNRGSCMGTSATLIFGELASQMMVGWVALDRLTAVADPMRYRGRDHPKLARHSWLFTMLFCFISVLSMFEGDLSVVPAVCNCGASWFVSFRTFWFVYSFVIAGVVIILYVATLITLRRTLGKATGNSALAVQIKRQAKVTKVISLILAVYVVCWVCPNLAFNGGFLLGLPKSILGLLGPTVASGCTISSAVNIFIYAYKLPEFWEYFKKFLKCQGDNAVHPVSGVGSHPTLRFGGPSHESAMPGSSHKENPKVVVLGQATLNVRPAIQEKPLVDGNEGGGNEEIEIGEMRNADSLGHEKEGVYHRSAVSHW